MEDARRARPRRAAASRARRSRRAARVRLARDLHAGARRQRGGRGARAAPRVRRRRRRIVVANTKGFTGHPMGVGIEDVVAVKALETGIVPPVANFKEVDPGARRR